MKKILKLEKDWDKIHNSARLFEVAVSEFKSLKLCMHEAQLVKKLWDHIDLIRNLIDEWTSSKWMGKRKFFLSFFSGIELMSLRPVDFTFSSRLFESFANRFVTGWLMDKVKQYTFLLLYLPSIF